MTVRRRLETALASAAALLSNLRARLSPAPCDLVGAVLCALAALFLILYAASGFAVLLGCGCALLLRGRRSQRALERWRLARPIVLLLAVPIGFYLLERPWNDQLLAMDPFYAAVNLCVLGALFAIVYAAGQRTRGAVVAFLAACLLAGTANHFVILFKGQPIVPADVFALSTAASVGAGYTFALDARLLEAVSVFAIASTAIAFLPKVAATPRRAVANGACALALASCFGWWIGTYDIEEVRRAGIDVVLPQTRAGSEPCTPRRIRCRCRFGPAALALRR